MNGDELREARLRAGWTQQELAGRLGVTQAYLSMAERGHRVLPSSLARKAVGVLHARPTALPLREEGVGAPSDSDKLRSELAALGYPGFAHLRGPDVRARRNPAEVLLNALHGADVDTRVVEGLPWLAFHYADLDWDWAVQNAKLHDLQNRLGFVATMASRLGVSPLSPLSPLSQLSPLSPMGASPSADSQPAAPPRGSAPAGEPRSRRLKEYAAVLESSGRRPRVRGLSPCATMESSLSKPSVW